MARMDPLWLLNHYHYLDNCRKGQAGLILSRYGVLGSHRYPIGFFQGIPLIWESLAFQPILHQHSFNTVIRGGVNDIGGHMYIMMKTSIFKLVAIWVLARSIVSIVLVMPLTVNRGFTSPETCQAG